MACKLGTRGMGKAVGEKPPSPSTKRKRQRADAAARRRLKAKMRAALDTEVLDILQAYFTTVQMRQAKRGFLRTEAELRLELIEMERLTHKAASRISALCHGDTVCTPVPLGTDLDAEMRRRMPDLDVELMDFFGAGEGYDAAEALKALDEIFVKPEHTMAPTLATQAAQPPSLPPLPNHLAAPVPPVATQLATPTFDSPI